MGKGTGRKFALGALVAGTVGFLVGLLSAPKSGKETREDLKKATIIAVSQIEKDLKTAHTELKELIQSVTTNIKDTSSQAKKDLKRNVEKAKKVQNKLRVAISSIHDGTSVDPELNAVLVEAKSAATLLKQYFSKS